MKKSFVHHICIQTNHYEKSIKFYTEGLGFKKVQESQDFHERAYNTWLQIGDFYIELQTGKKGEQLRAGDANNQGLAHFCLWVDNLTAEVAHLLQLQMQFKMKDGEYIYQVENGALCKVIAPEGTIVELRDQRGM
ncbi:VOC family protein [Viridibacillus sp. YIM B01967]|uniref:VOC family protein n=1 Tax=Viridibacillus soli TaxID=2798301 RepID=A0ABS1HCA7_9BACL|nr:VOC family protein [Viridibacillus soli]MBK3497044.1 VOC family protein [Viridibacillus soli]